MAAELPLWSGVWVPRRRWCSFTAEAPSMAVFISTPMSEALAANGAFRINPAGLCQIRHRSCNCERTGDKRFYPDAVTDLVQGLFSPTPDLLVAQQRFRILRGHVSPCWLPHVGSNPFSIKALVATFATVIISLITSGCPELCGGVSENKLHCTAVSYETRWSNDPLRRCHSGLFLWLFRVSQEEHVAFSTQRFTCTWPLTS